MFSCDKAHMWTRQVFFEMILPKFKSLITALPTDLSVTAQFLLAEYHLVRSSFFLTYFHHQPLTLVLLLNQRTMRLACPLCVFNTLATEQNSLSSVTTPIKLWTE